MKVTAILTADIHIPHSIIYQPRCRLDNYWLEFQRKMEWLRELSKKYSDPQIFDAGDLCDNIRLDPEVESWAIYNLPNNIFTIPGNHEIPNHNLNYLHQSSLSVIEAGRAITIIGSNATTRVHFEEFGWLYGFPYGSNWKDFHIPKNELDGRHIALIHDMVSNTPMKSQKIAYIKAIQMLKELPQFDLIVTGHNHKSFATEYENRWLVNPGSLMRSTVDQVDHEPTVYLWDSENNTVLSVKVPIRQEVITDRYIKRKISIEEGDDMKAFIEKLNQSSTTEVSYEKNLEEVLFEEKPKESVKKLIYGVMK